ncbi:MAG: methyltransferase domain-containing protein [Phyllobacteriaceae bacterium]|nr:methyltransferase domain-containing protein [Phyllobacteriaceae bacterium]
MQCGYFDAGVCRSCTLMGMPYGAQLDRKVNHAKELLSAWSDAEWLEPVTSQWAGFRNKAKMVVGGTIETPTLGILDPAQNGVDLTGCGVITQGLRNAFEPIKTFITKARIPPYDVGSRRGELKFVHLTEASDGQLMLRFVLRSTEPLGRMKKWLSELAISLPQLHVVTANLLPEHKAVLEGPEEIHLGGAEALPMPLGGIVLQLKPASFFQTNTAIARGLYSHAREWVDGAGARSVLDLYCGVGGFALHAAAPGRTVHGVEISEPAVQSARQSAAEAGLSKVTFAVGDATALDGSSDRDLVIVNPPRRGLGEKLCATLEGSGASTLIYSSCNAVTLARDLAALNSYDVRQVRLFDMFPQTEHYEIMALLVRKV